MDNTSANPASTESPVKANWGAVCALTLCVATLISSEFMPVSLLTPIATDLDLTEGQAGQAIAVSGIFAVLTSLFIATASGKLDRRTLLLGLVVAMLASGAITAFAPNYAVLMIGRALIGIVIGGFWSMSAATVMRLVPARDVPKGLAILNGGNALATTIAAPLGSFMGQFIGWRGAFFAVVPLAVITLIWLLYTLPSMPNEKKAETFAAFRILRQPVVALGMLAAAMFFLGQFALFTYLRPFLESVAQVDVSTLSFLILLMGVAGLVGTFLVDGVLRDHLYSSLIVMPLLMGALALGLVLFGSSVTWTAALLVFWGLIGTAAPVGWWAWVSKALPNDAEAGGGLMVAVIQLAITAGAGVGGLLFDSQGYQYTFMLSALAFCACAGAAAVTAFAHKASVVSG
ncbi:MAG: MFS transporter [Burkholderiales bacterium]|nr:MAG: MFS transporter [Burkholderiales bacterium]